MFTWLRPIARRIQQFDLLPDYFTAVAQRWLDILWGASLIAILFALWWIFGNPSAWKIAIYLVAILFVAGYYVWRADHVQLISNLSIKQFYVTQTPTSGPESIVVIHVVPECLTNTPIEGCRGHLLRVQRRSHNTQPWQATEIDEPSNLAWSIHDNTLPRTLYPGVLTRLNLCSIGEAGHIRLMGGPYSSSLGVRV
jgi:hypothetical protein